MSVVALGALVSSISLVAAVGGHAAVSSGSGDESLTYQVDAAHDGTLAGATEAPPLAKRWTRDLGAAVSYPVVTAGKVFVTAGSSGGAPGTTLYALDAGTGQNAWAPVALGGTYWWSALASGNGQLFALTDAGILRAFDPATGAQQWSTQLPGQFQFTSPPTYANGFVYTGGAGSGGTVYAVRASDGSVAWTAPVANGDHSSPAVSASGVYTSYACEQAYDFDPASGALVWHHATTCSGGGGRTPMLANGQAWVRDSAGMAPAVLDALSGAPVGTFAAAVAPAFDGGRVYALNGSVLQATAASGGAAAWSFSGDGQLVSAPIVVNGYVYEASATGTLWALNETNGSVAWSGAVGGGVAAPDERNVSQPLTGLAAGQGLVVVPASTSVVAFGHADTDLALSLPANITVNATGHAGAAVSFAATATDAGGTPSVSCGQPSGATFPIGTTTVTCSASDADDLPASVSGSFTVTVNDTDLALALPGNIQVNAPNRHGTRVSFTVAAFDEGSEVPPTFCNHASGSMFPGGTTTVTCSASDSDDTPGTVSGSFTVTVAY